MATVDLAATVTDVQPLRPQAGRQWEFAKSTADVTIYGGKAGGGKTFGILLQPTLHAGIPGFGAVIFRRTYPEIMNEGGLWDEAANIYPLVGGEPQVGRMWYNFPSGARVSFRQISNDQDLHNYDGAQIALVEFDQLEHFTKRQFLYMLSRNRSTCGVKPYLRATCNPQPNWLADFLEWWIDQETGYAREDRAGLTRWFLVIGDEVEWADTREELEAKYAHYDPPLIPKSCCFIPASLEDNPALTQADPGYIANLMALPYVDRERLLKGNWKIRDSDGTEWPSEYFMGIFTNDWPERWTISAIAVDPSKGVKSGDPSGIVFLGLSGGKLYADADIEIRPSEKILADGVAMALRDWPDAFGIEANGFQELLGDQYHKMCEKQEIPPLPIHLIHNHVNKQIRIRRLGPYMKAGKLRVRNTPGGRKLVEQLSGFPLNDVHDDGPDALEMALRLITTLANQPQRKSTRIVV